MEPKIATIDTSIAGALVIINDKGTTTYYPANYFRMEKKATEDRLLLVNADSGKLMYTYISGVDPDITITDGTTPVIYDGTTPGVNDFAALTTAVASLFFLASSGGGFSLKSEFPFATGMTFGPVYSLPGGRTWNDLIAAHQQLVFRYNVRVTGVSDDVLRVIYIDTKDLADTSRWRFEYGVAIVDFQPGALGGGDFTFTGSTVDTIGLEILGIEKNSQAPSLSEALEAVIDEQTISSGGTLTLPANLSDYDYLRFEVAGAGAANVSVSETIKVSDVPSSRVAMHHDDSTGYIYFDINAANTLATLTATVAFTGSMVARVIGRKKVATPSVDAQYNVQTGADFTAIEIEDYRDLTFMVQSTLDTDQAITFPLAFSAVPKEWDVQLSMKLNSGLGDTGLSLVENTISATGLTVNRADSIANGDDPWIIVRVRGLK